MYTSYVSQRAHFIICVIFCACFVKCEIFQENCTIYQHVYKENLRNCLVNLADLNISHAFSGSKGVEKTFIQNYKIVHNIDENNNIFGSKGVEKTFIQNNKIVHNIDENNNIFDTRSPKKIRNQHNPILPKRTLWKIPLTEKLNILISQINEETLTLQLTHSPTAIGARKKQTNLQDVIPYFIIPGFIMAGVVPWLIPGLKLAVMAVGMVNQMAFTSSLFTLIRGYIFDTSQQEHLVYINNGYNKYKHIKTPHTYR